MRLAKLACCRVNQPRFVLPGNWNTRIMAQAAGSGAAKKLIQIDISSDSVCPWCYVGKKNLDKAIAATKDQFDFEVRWHPFFLNPSAPKEGVNKRDFYEKKFGAQAAGMFARMTQVYRNLGLEYDISGLTGCSLDSHRLIYFVGKQGFDKQHRLVEELFHGYFTQGKYIGNRDFLLECAAKVEVEGAVEFLDDPKNGVKEVNEDLERYSKHINGVPHFVLNGKQELSGGQAPELFMRAFQAVAE